MSGLDRTTGDVALAAVSLLRPAALEYLRRLENQVTDPFLNEEPLPAFDPNLSDFLWDSSPLMDSLDDFPSFHWTADSSSSST
jgi:hypothetical protein